MAGHDQRCDRKETGLHDELFRELHAGRRPTNNATVAKLVNAADLESASG